MPIPATASTPDSCHQRGPAGAAAAHQPRAASTAPAVVPAPTGMTAGPTRPISAGAATAATSVPPLKPSHVNPVCIAVNPTHCWR